MHTWYVVLWMIRILHVQFYDHFYFIEFYIVRSIEWQFSTHKKFRRSYGVHVLITVNNTSCKVTKAVLQIKASSSIYSKIRYSNPTLHTFLPYTVDTTCKTSHQIPNWNIADAGETRNLHFAGQFISVVKYRVVCRGPQVLVQTTQVSLMCGLNDDSVAGLSPPARGPTFWYWKMGLLIIYESLVKE